MRGNSSGHDRDASFLLLFHEVGRGRAVVRLAHLIILTGIVENSFGCCRLAGVDMRHDTDVPDKIQGDSFHLRFSFQDKS